MITLHNANSVCSLHMQHLIPRWQDADKHRRLKIIMSDRPDLINSEMGGVAFNSVDQCFKQSLLKQMFNETIPLNIEFNTRFFVTVDPAAGGEHSDFAMVSFTYCHGIFKVISCACKRGKDDSTPLPPSRVGERVCFPSPSIRQPRDESRVARTRTCQQRFVIFESFIRMYQKVEYYSTFVRT